VLSYRTGITLGGKLPVTRKGVIWPAVVVVPEVGAVVLVVAVGLEGVEGADSVLTVVDVAPVPAWLDLPAATLLWEAVWFGNA
jgi:hypothetical protein